MPRQPGVLWNSKQRFPAHPASRYGQYFKVHVVEPRDQRIAPGAHSAHDEWVGALGYEQYSGAFWHGETLWPNAGERKRLVNWLTVAGALPTYPNS